MQLKLLELTRERHALNLADLQSTQQVNLNTKLDNLRELGLISVSNGLLRMDSQQRIALAEQLIHSGADPKKTSRFLGWQEFEDFTEHTFSANGFHTVKHFVFKSKNGRREIDILAWNDTLTLAVDCKHWVRGLSSGRMQDAARAQIERVVSLANRPDLLKRIKVDHAERRSIMPVILALGDLRERIVEGVPIVSVSKLVSFIYGVSPVGDGIKRVLVSGFEAQSRLM
ncbi:MAG: restriction endonuclease [Candidatus Bathyarchaeia archaeon]